MIKQTITKNLCGIYKITSPSGKIYIGQSINIYKRVANYKKAHCKPQIHLHRSIKKYGWDEHIFEIIQECAVEELDKLEKYYVDLFQTFNSENGLNIKDGGGKSGRMSEETKIKIGIGNKGKVVSDEVKKKIGHISSLKKLSISHKNKFNFTGRNHSDQWKLTASIRNKGENNPMFGKGNFGDKNGMYGKKRKKSSLELMSKLILNVETGIFYFGIQEAAYSIGMNYNRLRDRLNGTTKNDTSFINA